MATTWKGIIDWPGGASTLNAAINNTVETIVLASDPGANMSTTNFYVRIGFEQILVASRTTVTLTCTGGRGANGTSAAAHLAGDTVCQDFFAAHVTAMRTAINNLEDGTTPAAKATALATTRAINGVNFDGSAAITVPVNNVNDVATNASFFLLFTATKDGNYAAKVADSKLFFNPSTGLLTATGFSGPLNGTVGAVTPNTVAGTTGTFSGGVSLAGTLAAANSAEKVINGDGSSTTGWTAIDGVASLDSGHLRITKSASASTVARLHQVVSLVVGKRYKVIYTYVGNGGGINHASFHIGSLPWNSEDYLADYISPGTVTAYFTAISATAYIDMDVWMANVGDSGGYTDWDNISLVEMGDGVFSGNVVAGLGLHVGGDSNPGNDNLIVDGDVLISGNDLDGATGTFNFLATPTTIIEGALCVAWTVGAATGVATINNAAVKMPNLATSNTGAGGGMWVDSGADYAVKMGHA